MFRSVLSYFFPQEPKCPFNEIEDILTKEYPAFEEGIKNDPPEKKLNQKITYLRNLHQRLACHIKSIFEGLAIAGLDLTMEEDLPNDEVTFSPLYVAINLKREKSDTPYLINLNTLDQLVSGAELSKQPFKHPLRTDLTDIVIDIPLTLDMNRLYRFLISQYSKEKPLNKKDLAIDIEVNQKSGPSLQKRKALQALKTSKQAIQQEIEQTQDDEKHLALANKLIAINEEIEALEPTLPSLQEKLNQLLIQQEAAPHDEQLITEISKTLKTIQQITNKQKAPSRGFAELIEQASSSSHSFLR